MAEQARTRPVTAVVAAFNEADRIATVLETLVGHPAFAEVVVVDDGSTDDTSAVAEAFSVTVLRVDPNRGKGHAMDLGVRHATTEIVFFADADITGLTHAMIDRIIAPVVAGDVDMFIAMRNRKIYLLRFLMFFIPLLGGERAVTTGLWQRVPDRYKRRFAIEAGLNFYATYYGRGLGYGVFPGITQTVKERKFGLLDGLRRRVRMFSDVLAAAWELETTDLPVAAQARRIAAIRVLLAAVGAVVGVVVLIATFVGPVALVSSVFAEELAEDPNALLVRFLLAVAGGVATPVLAAIGSVIALTNTAFLAVNLARLAGLGPTRRVRQDADERR